MQGAIFPFRQGDLQLTAGLLQESLDLYQELGDEEGIARSTAELGGIAIAEGNSSVPPNCTRGRSALPQPGPLGRIAA